MRTIKILIALVCLSSTPAFAAVIDFEDQPFGALAGETLVVDIDGITVTFQGTGLQIRSLGGDFDTAYGQTRYLSTDGDSQQITVTFSGGSAEYVTILNPINGTVTGEVDIIDAEALDGGDGTLDSVTSSDELLTLNGPGIVKVTYDDDGTGYVIGYLEFEATAAATPVPTISTWATLLLMLMLGGFAFRRIRQT